MPSQAYAVRYDPLSSPETGHVEEYKILEISAELAKIIEQAEREGEAGVRLTMKGTPQDDAVICTQDHTFSLRTITVSNSIIFLRPSDPTSTPTSAPTTTTQTAGDLYIQDTCHEILELTPSVPRLARVEKLLKPSAWPGMERGTKRSRDEAGNVETEGGKKVKRYTRAQMQSIVQASDGELDVGLRERNVIVVDDHLLHLPTRHLFPLLSTIISLLTIHSDPTDQSSPKIPTRPLIDALRDEYSISPDIGRGVMQLCGEVRSDGEEETWEVDLGRMVREVGRGRLALESAIDPPAVDTFMAKWKDAVGEYSHVVDLKLLEGEHLLKPPPTSAPGKQPLIQPFSVTTLPQDPAARFTDLFLTRPRWRPEEMQPFLRGLTPVGDRKAMDKLVVKYVRVVKESGREGSMVWWHARR